MPNSDDVDVSLPPTTTIKELKDHLLASELNIPGLDGQNNPIVYQLIVKGKNEVLIENQPLHTQDVEDGDLLLMIPRVIAGKS